MEEKIKAVATAHGFEIVANRQGLMDLARVCRQLASLPEDPPESRRLGNHYHYAPWMNNAEEDSVEFSIRYKPEL